jgi:DnaD/phage-associated family protein
MEYYINLGCFGGVFAVPNAVADEYIKLASGTAIKVLLYSLRNNNKNIPASEIAEALNISEESVEDAFCFWEQLNIISKEKSFPAKPVQNTATAQVESSRSNVESKTIQAKSNNTNVQKIKTPHSSDRLNPSEIANRINESQELKIMFECAEKSFNSMLNGTVQNTLIWLHDYLGFSVEVILMLIEYCSSIGKCSAGYIEKIAINWHENGITDFESASAEIKRLIERRSYTYKIINAFGINHKLTTTQQKFINNWQEKGFSVDLVFFAYEKTIDSIEKLSFPYIDKILIDWEENGITTKEMAEEQKRKFASEKDNSPSYNPDLFDSLAVNNPVSRKDSLV